MSKFQLNTWRIFCDKCGRRCDVVTEGNFAPSPSELAKHGFHIMLTKHDDHEHLEQHLCNECFAETISLPY